MSTRIVITGYGIVSAIGLNKQETLQSLLEERSGIAPMRYLHSQEEPLPVGEVKLTNDELKQELGIASSVISRTALLGIKAAREALQDAGISNTEDMVLLSGTTVGGMDQTEQLWTNREQPKTAQAIVSVHSVGSSTKQIARYVGPFERLFTPSTACSSALNAIITACNLIRMGKIKRALAGGAEALSVFHLNGFRSLQILDTEPCRPFCQTRAGLNLGEGAAYVVLETEEEAMARGAEIIAYIGGYGNACDAFHQTASSDNGEGAYLAMQKAIAMGGMSVNDIDYVNAHGTATPNNDATETVAIQRLFNSKMPMISSTKAFTGHATSAAGSIELVISLIAMQNGFAPANLNLKEQIPNGIAPIKHNTNAAMTTVLCNSFGFGGNDSSLLVTTRPTDLSYNDSEPALTVASEVIATATADYKQYMSALEARRLTPALRRLVVAARRALEEAHIEIPDAIITATSLGCIVNSVALLDSISTNGELSVKPTMFMQSTHNTPSSLIAIQIGAHGYNATYSDDEESYDNALIDATAQMQLGLIHNALVLQIDEECPEWQELTDKAYTEYEPIVKATMITAC